MSQSEEVNGKFETAEKTTKEKRKVSFKTIRENVCCSVSISDSFDFPESKDNEQEETKMVYPTIHSESSVYSEETLEELKNRLQNTRPVFPGIKPKRMKPVPQHKKTNILVICFLMVLIAIVTLSIMFMKPLPWTTYIFKVDCLPDGETKEKCINRGWTMFGSISVFAVCAMIAAIVVYEQYRRQSEFRVDCMFGDPLNYDNCLKRGCHWRTTEVKGEPSCFFPVGYGYKFLEDPVVTAAKVTATLDRTNKAYSIYGNEINKLNLTVYYETNQRVHFKVTDPTKQRYEVPIEIPDIPAKPPKFKDYVVELVDDPQFGIQIRRASNKKLIFDTNTPGTIFSDQLLQITIKLPSKNIYGLGEHITRTYRHDVNWRKWSFFARDEGPMDDNNLYGVHPFYMVVEEDGNAHGVFFLNSNALEVILQPHPAITFRAIGGIMDFYIFMGPTPEDVVKQYLQVIGLPLMPTYWSLGFQLSKWGYGNVTNIKKIVSRTIDAKIPYDVQFFDIDYMEENRDFTYDDVRFGNLPELVQWLNERNIRVVIILDPAIASNKTLIGSYPPLDVGLQMDVFVKAANGSNLEAMVWPGLTYYPDFSHPKAEEYWYKLCNDFYETVPYSGLWIDMNEPASFADGSVTGCEKNKWNYPPYAAGVMGSHKDGKLFEKTICMDSKQHAGIHYDVHSLYGYFHAKVTYSVLKRIIQDKRPMVLSRSTYPGSGKYTVHWLGDNRSRWSQLRESIPGILEFNLFGIPYVGADICGFWENTTRELCARWSQLGAFYPFSRNHNGMEFNEQDPVALGDLVVTASRQALQVRYTLLPYLYTLFHYAHVEGSTVARPLLHEFPTDKATWDINFQFLWGSALLISPVVYPSVKPYEAYFPAGVWYDYYTGERTKLKKGKTIRLTPRWDKINLHVRGGYVLPLQTPSATTTESRKNPMQLLVAPDVNEKADGSLFWDDGESFDTYNTNKYLLLTFNYSVKNGNKNELNIAITKDGYDDPSNLIFSGIKFYGQDSSPIRVMVDESEHLSDKWKYDEKFKVVVIEELELSINMKHTIILENVQSAETVNTTRGIS